MYGEAKYLKNDAECFSKYDSEVLFDRKAGRYQYRINVSKPQRKYLELLHKQIEQYKNEIKEINKKLPKEDARSVLGRLDLQGKIRRLRINRSMYQDIIKATLTRNDSLIQFDYPSFMRKGSWTRARKDLYYTTRSEFSHRRNQLRYRKQKPKVIENYYPEENRYERHARFMLVGLVNELPGLYRKAYLKKKVAEMFRDKKPENTRANYIGVELEFCAGYDKYKLGEMLHEKNLLRYCKWSDDHSLRPKDNEKRHELAILVKESQIGILKRICKVVEESGAVAKDRRCGLHVHLDCRTRDKEVVYNNLVACQNWLMRMSDPKRRDGEFCSKVSSRTFPSSFDGSRFERYKTVNAASYYRHKTIEVRTHEGTVNADDIINWVTFLVKIARHKSKVRRMVPSIKKMVDTFKIDDKMETYVRDRVNYWNVNGDGSLFASTRPARGLRFEDVAPPENADLEQQPVYHVSSSN